MMGDRAGVVDDPAFQRAGHRDRLVITKVKLHRERLLNLVTKSRPRRGHGVPSRGKPPASPSP